MYNGLLLGRTAIGIIHLIIIGLLYSLNRSRYSMFEYLEREELVNLLEQYPEDMNIIIDESVSGERKLIDTLENGIDSKYEEDNWDGLYDAIGTLAWITNRTIRFVHLGLPVLCERDQRIYFSILRDVCHEWHDAQGKEHAHAQNIRVHFYFSLELKEEVEAILAQI